MKTAGVSTRKQLPLAMTMGDPAGVGPAITIEAWNRLRTDASCAFFVIGAQALYEASIPVRPIDSPSEAMDVFAEALPVLALDPFPLPAAGRPDPATATAIIDSIRTATRLCLTGDAAGMVTNPINKALLYGSGFSHPGHTEYVAALCEAHTGTSLRPVMLLTGGGLRVALATIHIPLREVSEHLDRDSLYELGQVSHRAMQVDFGIRAPRIAFTGLNPHAGETGSIGHEEIEIINPAAAALRSAGIDISDARPADTVFAEALAGQFDMVIAMTHDQGLIPVKTLDFWGGVNSTLGLPIVRTSPDHGTGYDAAAAGKARADSLIAAIRLARQMADNRKAASA